MRTCGLAMPFVRAVIGFTRARRLVFAFGVPRDCGCSGSSRPRRSTGPTWLAGFSGLVQLPCPKTRQCLVVATDAEWRGIEVNETAVHGQEGAHDEADDQAVHHSR